MNKKQHRRNNSIRTQAYAFWVWLRAPYSMSRDERKFWERHCFQNPRFDARKGRA